MRTPAFPLWLCLALLLCCGSAHAERLFSPPDDPFQPRTSEDLTLDPPADDDDELEEEDVPPASRPPDLPSSRPRPRLPGAPAVGLLNRTGALTIDWFTAPLRFTYSDWKTAAVFTTIPLVLILSGFDDKTFNLLTKHHTPSKDRLAERVDRLGEVPVAFSVLSGFGAYGYVFDDPRGVHTFESGIIATALAGGLTTALKYATGRTRPTAGVGSKEFAPFGGEMSFPSGHTTVAFSLAGVINYHYPGWVGRTALLAACGTAWARVYNLHHWPSDVVFAAMVSSATAHYVARANLAAARGDLTFDPVFLNDGGGMAVRRRF